ncbi:phage tail sheath C-terminal domain-containing protein [Fluviibacterium sp. DFM31]|uniref:Phage tail sheath C-terminal domain-containing protein n=1 Tax=Meridianimarinicoccus marinus TaxID=3231483 RepID=A0ABV3L7B8_9RHOB
MTMPLTPGIYIEPVQPVRATGPLERGDVPVFLGYARRGPFGVPVRIESRRQFEDLFGAPFVPGHLAGAVGAFFETGGTVCYIVRVTGQGAQAAEAAIVPDDPTVQVPDRVWRARASFPWPRINPRALQGSGNPGAQAWAAAFDAQVQTYGRRTPDPGAWGNGLRVEILRQSLVAAETEPGRLEDGMASQLFNLAGLEPHSILELHQEIAGQAITATAEIARIDAARQMVWWKTPPDALDTGGPALDPTAAIRIASVEFRVDIYVDGRLVERFENLGPHPDHSRALESVIAEECRNLDLAPDFDTDAATDWTDPATWPALTSVQLSGGWDAVSTVTAEDYLRALGAPPHSGAAQAVSQARVDEIALVAAPDLVLQPPAPEPVSPPPPPPEIDCGVLEAPAAGRLTGLVLSAGTGSDAQPLPGVRVEVAGQGRVATTAADGTFLLDGLPLALVTLRFAKAGFADLETLAQAVEFTTGPPVQFALEALVDPRQLTESEILTVQAAMMSPAIVGPYRVAVLDPPSAGMKLDDLRSWRAKLGDSARGAFFGPWLRVPAGETGGTALQPPCGHVCGALALGEHETGIHRAPANLQLRQVEGVALDISDAEQALLNPIGLNAIRAFPGRGIRLWGTRSLSSNPDWRYITSRRLVDAIEKTLERALQWAVFEPNNAITRQAVVLTVRTLLEGLWRQGALAGAAPREAFTVKSDFENNPQADRDAGRMIVEIGVAPSIPFEFILFRLGRTLDAIEVRE